MRWQPPLHISTCDVMSKMSEGRQISVFDMPSSIIEHLPVSSSSLPDRDSVRKRYFKWSLTIHRNHEWQKYGNETSASDNCLNGFRLLLRKGEHGHLCRASQEYFVTVPFLLVRIANIYIWYAAAWTFTDPSNGRSKMPRVEHVVGEYSEVYLNPESTFSRVDCNFTAEQRATGPCMYDSVQLLLIIHHVAHESVCTMRNISIQNALSNNTPLSFGPSSERVNEWERDTHPVVSRQASAIAKSRISFATNGVSSTYLWHTRASKNQIYAISFECHY